MADSLTSSQNTQSTGSNTGTLWRDVNASASLGELLNNFNASNSASDSGHITVGNRIIGGEKRTRKFNLLQTLAFIGIGLTIYKIYQQGAK